MVQQRKLVVTFSVNTIYGPIENLSIALGSQSTETPVTEIFPPLALDGEAINSTSVQANYTKSLNATNYLLFASEDNFATHLDGFNGLDVGDLQTYTITGSSGNTEISYRLKATNGIITSEYSNIKKIKTLPPVPEVLPATSITSSGFTANWEEMEGITDFLFYAYDSDDIVLDDYNGISVTGTSYVVSGLDPAMDYSYNLKAVNDSGYSGLSDSEPVQTIVDAPETNSPSSVTATGYTANWSTVPGATYLFYAYDSDDIVLDDYNGISVAGTSQAVTGLTADTQNSYKVKAVINSINSVFSNVEGPFYTLPNAFTPALSFPITTTSGTSGSTETDSVYGAVMTLVGTTISTQASSLGGGELKTTSSNSYGNVPYSTNYYSANKITFEVIFKLDALGEALQVLFAQDEVSSPEKGFIIYINDTNDIKFAFTDGAGHNLEGYFESSAILNTSNYFYFSFTLDLDNNTLIGVLCEDGVSSNILTYTLSTGGIYLDLTAFTAMSNSLADLNIGGYYLAPTFQLRGVLKYPGIYIDSNILNTTGIMIARAAALGIS
jgi:hypothetical protein